jgi:hypothetical protein
VFLKSPDDKVKLIIKYHHQNYSKWNLTQTQFSTNQHYRGKKIGSSENENKSSLGLLLPEGGGSTLFNYLLVNMVSYPS